MTTDDTLAQGRAGELGGEVILERIEARVFELIRSRDYWLAVHALRVGEYKLPIERLAEFDPLGMDKNSYEWIADQMTDEELSEAALAGADDYWESADSEALEEDAADEGKIAAFKEAWTIVSDYFGNPYPAPWAPKEETAA